MSPDHRILLRHGGIEVLMQAYPIDWPDGTTLALHPVRPNGIDSLFNRALRLDDGSWIVFDLRDVWPPLQHELPTTYTRDVPGVVRYTLRHQFATAGAVLQQACGHALMQWVPMPQAEAA
ncbi:hypothetical protein [Methylibium sp.]|uniref:hypothetical protein n=1 Tax=Methylibium sp. TaxID=2067992 RepID=UPI003D0BA08D